MPLWLSAPVCALAAWAVLDRLPGARWCFRRKGRRVLHEVGARLDVALPPCSSWRGAR